MGFNIIGIMDAKYPTLKKQGGVDFNKNGKIDDSEKLADLNGDGKFGEGEYFAWVVANARYIHKPILDNILREDPSAVEEMAAAEKDKAKKIELFGRALNIAAADGDAESQARVVGLIARKMVSAGLSLEALTLARKISNADVRVMMVEEVVMEVATRCHDSRYSEDPINQKSSIWLSGFFMRALDVIGTAKGFVREEDGGYLSYRARGIETVVREMRRSGFGGGRLFKKALSVIDMIEKACAPKKLDAIDVLVHELSKPPVSFISREEITQAYEKKLSIIITHENAKREIWGRIGEVQDVIRDMYSDCSAARVARAFRVLLGFCRGVVGAQNKRRWIENVVGSFRSRQLGVYRTTALFTRALEVAETIAVQSVRKETIRFIRGGIQKMWEEERKEKEIRRP